MATIMPEAAVHTVKQSAYITVPTVVQVIGQGFQPLQTFRYCRADFQFEFCFTHVVNQPVSYCLFSVLISSNHRGGIPAGELFNTGYLIRNVYQWGEGGLRVQIMQTGFRLEAFDIYP